MAHSAGYEGQELSSLGQNHQQDHEDDDASNPMENDETLPPADHGRGAYLALACCTMAQAPIWGITRPLPAPPNRSC